MLIKDKKFYKNLLIIALPIALQNLIANGLNLMDSLMVARVSQSAVSSVSLANQPGFILSLLFFGISSGAAVLASQYWGKGETKVISKLIGIAMRFASIAAIIFFILTELFPVQIMSLFTSDPNIISEGVSYLRIIAFTYLCIGITMTYMVIIRSAEKVKISLYLSIITFFMNVFLNYILIFGKLGAPKLGIEGAAIATVISRLFELTVTIVYAKKFNNVIKFKFKYIIEKNRVLLKDFFSYSLPVVYNEFLWGLGISMQSVIMGHLSSEAVTAYSIAALIQNFCVVFLIGLANASAVIVGKTIGTGDEKYAKKTGATLLTLSFGIGIFTALLIILIIPIMNLIYPLSGITKSYLNTILITNACYALVYCPAILNIVGVFRGGGDTKFSLLLDIISLWICSILFGFLGAYVFKFSVPIVYIILKSDEIVKFVVGLYRFKGGKWLKNVLNKELLS